MWSLLCHISLRIFFFHLLTQIYPNELEAQPEFNGFNDMLQTFDIYRGKGTGDDFLDKANIVGKLKVRIRNVSSGSLEALVFTRRRMRLVTTDKLPDSCET
jgi:hypothetical protein